MSPRSSQPLIWTCVALLTLGLHAAALLLIHLPNHEEPEDPQHPTRLDLSILTPAPPAPAPEPAPVEPPVEPEPPTPEPEPVEPPPPVPDPPVVEPKPDPALIKKQQEQLEREKKVQEEQQRRAQERAKKRMAEKRRQAKAAREARAKKDAKAAAARKRNAEAKRIASKPSPINQKKPRYPASAIRANKQGTTVLSITIGTNGRVTSVRIAKSSGHAVLDRAALSVVRTWRFKPAKNGLGQSVPYTMKQAVPFTIR